MEIEARPRITLITAARLAGVSRDTLKRWERRGLYHATRDWRGARVFTQSDILKLRELAGLDIPRADSD